MGRIKRGLFPEIHLTLQQTIEPISYGWKRLIPLIVFLLFILMFGLAAATMIALGVVGMYAIYIIVKANDNLMRMEELSKSKSKKNMSKKKK